MAKQTFTTGQVLTAAQMTSLQETAMGGGPATAKTASYVLVAADAGTTVAMNAAGATTITVNTGLFAAGDTVFIQNLGAGACTVTAGTATVATAGSLILPQNDAGILYFTSASAAIFYDYIQVGATSPLTTKGDLYTFGTSDDRLGVGANGTTLVANSSEATGLEWVTPAAAGGYTLLSTTSLSGSTTTVSSISAAHKHLLIIVEGAYQAASNSALTYQLNGSTNNQQIRLKYINAAATAGGSEPTAFDLGLMYSSSDKPFNMQLFIPRYSDSQKHPHYLQTMSSDGSNWIMIFGNNKLNDVSVISSFTIAAAANFAAGTIYIYGVS